RRRGDDLECDQGHRSAVRGPRRDQAVQLAAAAFRAVRVRRGELLDVRTTPTADCPVLSKVSLNGARRLSPSNGESIMKSIVIPAVLTVLLAAAGVVFWTMGKAEQRLADAHREMATLQYADASAESDATVAARPLVQRLGGFGDDEQVDAR